MISIKNISFAYGDKAIFNNFSLNIPDGSTVCLSAPSGFGKTTLLRLIMGLEKPQRGEITGVSGADFSCVFQEDRLLPHKTVLKNVSLFGYEGKALSILEKLGISEAARKYPQELSGGMKRRVALARALVCPGDIYIFDEALSGLDDEAAAAAAREIKNVCVSNTVICVSHNPRDITLLDAEYISL